jgi:hypothetical protein
LHLRAYEILGQTIHLVVVVVGELVFDSKVLPFHKPAFAQALLEAGKIRREFGACAVFQNPNGEFSSACLLLRPREGRGEERACGEEKLPASDLGNDASFLDEPVGKYTRE